MSSHANHAQAGMEVLAALKAAPPTPPAEAQTDTPVVVAARDVSAAPAPASKGRRAKERPAPEARTPRARRPRPERRKPAAPTPAVEAAAAAATIAAPQVPAVVAPAPPAAVPAAPAPAAKVAPAGRTAAPKPAPATAQADRLVVRPKKAARRLAGLLLLVFAPLTGLAIWTATTTRDTTLIGVALILGALTLGLWFMRVISVPTTVSIIGPQLEVRRGQEVHRWDLSSAYSPVDHVRSRPGRSAWRVVLRTADGSTFAIDGSMVPARRFMEILKRYRPEL